MNLEWSPVFGAQGLAWSPVFDVDPASTRTDGGLSTRRRYRPRPDDEPAPPVAKAPIAAPAAPLMAPLIAPAWDEEEDEMLLAATVLLLMH